MVIDNTSQFRMDPDVPLVVPEVNRGALKGFHKRNIVANPNCSTIQMVVALKPLHDLARIKRVVVATYQSVSGAGKEAMDELFEHTKAIYMNDRKEPVVFKKADPVQRHSPDRRLPGGRLDQGGMEDGGRDQEDPRPQDRGHRHLRARAGVRRPRRGGQRRVRERRSAPTRRARRCARPRAWWWSTAAASSSRPAECVGEYGVFVSRIRKDPTVRHGLNLWVVSDNLRKGAALNAVQIAEAMVEDGLI